MTSSHEVRPDPLEQVVQELADGTASAGGLLERTLARMAAEDDGPGGLRAVVTTSPRARAEAEESDRRREQGRPRSTLDGVPVLVKDCIETSGMPTTHGSTLFASWRAPADAPAVAALRRAGAVIVGTASLDDFAAATAGVSSLRGTMVNPADRTRTVGGSSGGSASAVAAGYVPLTLGTDTGGSLRIPAAACGVVTIRPTPGLVPTEGVFPRSFGQDAVGPIAGSVLGAALGLEALAPRAAGRPGRHGGDGAGPVGQWVRAALGARRDVGAALTGLRIGVLRTGLAAWGDDPEGPVVALLDSLVGRLEEAGAIVVEASAPDRDLLSASALVTLESAAAVDAYLATRPTAPVRTFSDLWKSQEFTEAAGVAFEREMAWSARDPGDARARALGSRQLLRRWTASTWAEQGVDLVVYPTAQRVAGPAGREQDGVYTRWAEHAGLPALSVPMGAVRSERGSALPAAVELVARPSAEGLLLRAGAAIEVLVRDRRPGSSTGV
ncbi:amidase [Oerskovia sp. KBS0722]|uniref:amidase n=1 Tax=Oerskovia sp. KBS0722 TaxID=1179673 RepID=UPI00110E1B31|nr:amidase [Oerskovia sp. KBS0722]QDW63355.1 amidase [Oerskovia sp. KBS0722]